MADNDLNYTAQEIDEMARAGCAAYWQGVYTDGGWEFLFRIDPEQWRRAVRAILRKRQEQALERLARDLFDPEKRAEWEKDLICPHCGKRIDEEIDAGCADAG